MRRSVHLRRAARRDGNEPAIIEALEKAGCLVKQSNDGSWDLIAYRSRSWRGGDVFLLEVKMPGQPYKPSQRQAIDDGWPVHRVETPEDALRVVGLLP
jgi:hypothetical protein